MKAEVPVGVEGLDARLRDNVVASLKTWDLGPVLNRLVTVHGLTKNDASNRIEEYRRFLIMAYLMGGVKNLPMSEPIDDVWHEHILHTRDYLAVCQATIGEYIHHRPTTSEVERDALLPDYHRNTLGLYRRIWGNPDPNYWPPMKCVCLDN